MATASSHSEENTLHFDVLIIGAGPAGLAGACRLRERGRRLGLDLSVAVLEKATRIGGHQISGALFDPDDLTPLIPDWRQHDLPLDHPVSREAMLLLTRRHALPLPVPRAWHHGTCHMISLGRLCRWLGERCEAAGVEIYPGFAAVEPLWSGDGEQRTLAGVRTGEMGRGRDGRPKPGYQPGVAVRAAVTILAEGCRGSLTRRIAETLALKSDGPPQTHALGFKEIWQTPHGAPGTVFHTLGWPMPSSTHGGGFVYGFQAGRTAVGFVAGLDYRPPLFDPFRVFQTWKTHPRIAALLAGGRPLSYGARTLTVGGWQCLPTLAWNGGLRVGDAAGFFNSATFQGIGNALRSGMMAADVILDIWQRGDFSAPALAAYPRAVRASDWGRDLKSVRNVRPGFRLNRWPGLLNAAWEGVTRGRSPWTWTWRQSDRHRLRPLSKERTAAQGGIADGRLTFDVSTLLALSGLRHEGDQPSHLRLADPALPLATGRERYDNPETRYCPARVFERLQRADGSHHFQIHPENCLHCKSCDIKDPFDNIRWTPPEGGDGPDYRDM